MKINEMEVSFGRKIPTGRFATDSIGLAMTVEMSAETKEELARQIVEAYSVLREFVDGQVWLSKQQIEARS